MTRSMLVAAGCLMLSGCLATKTATYPLELRPGSYATDGSWREDGGRDSRTVIKLPTAINAEQAIGRATAYAETFAKQAGHMHLMSHTASEAGFAGAITGVVGGLTKSPELIVGGAVLGAGGSAAEARYQYKVQSANYLKASDALYCMERVMVSEAGSLDPAGKAAVIDHGLVNREIDIVVSKLGRTQMNIALATPDLTELEAAVNNGLGRNAASEQADEEAVEALRAEPPVEAEGARKKNGRRSVPGEHGDLAQECVESRSTASVACKRYASQDDDAYETNDPVVKQRNLSGADQLELQKSSAVDHRMSLLQKQVADAAAKARAALSAEVEKCAASY